MEDTKSIADNVTSQEPDVAPFVYACESDTKEDVARKLRIEAARRAGIASCMRFGKTRACEFAFIAGLQEAADLLEGKHMYLACPKPNAVIFDVPTDSPDDSGVTVHENRQYDRG